MFAEPAVQSIKELTPAKPNPRSYLDRAVQDVATWNEHDRRLFVESFTTNKSGPQIAHEMGMTMSAYLDERKSLLRRFMRAAKAK